MLLCRGCVPATSVKLSLNLFRRALGQAIAHLPAVFDTEANALDRLPQRPNAHAHERRARSVVRFEDVTNDASFRDPALEVLEQVEQESEVRRAEVGARPADGNRSSAKVDM